MANELVTLIHDMSFQKDHLQSMATHVGMGFAEDKNIEELDLILEVVEESMRDANVRNGRYKKITGDQDEAPYYQTLIENGNKVIQGIDKLRDSYPQRQLGEQ